MSTNISHDTEQAAYEVLVLVKFRAGSSVVAVETFVCRTPIFGRSRRGRPGEMSRCFVGCLPRFLETEKCCSVSGKEFLGYHREYLGDS